MSLSEHLVVWPAVTLGFLIGAVATFRIWRRGADFSAATEWATGDTGRAGYNAFLGPAAVSILFIGLSLGTAQIWDPSDADEPLRAIPVTFFALGMLCMGLAWWLYLFLWPKFLVPPRLRGHDGVVRSVLRAQRQRKPDRPADGGDHRRS